MNDKIRFRKTAERLLQPLFSDLNTDTNYYMMSGNRMNHGNFHGFMDNHLETLEVTF